MREGKMQWEKMIMYEAFFNINLMVTTKQNIELRKGTYKAKKWENHRQPLN